MEQTYEIFDLPEELTVHRAAETQQQMIEWQFKKEVKCRGSDVTVIDAAGLQLLLSLYKTITKNGGKFIIIDPSSELQNVIVKAGVQKVFSVEEVS